MINLHLQRRGLGSMRNMTIARLAIKSSKQRQKQSNLRRRNRLLVKLNPQSRNWKYSKYRLRKRLLALPQYNQRSPIGNNTGGIANRHYPLTRVMRRECVINYPILRGLKKQKIVRYPKYSNWKQNLEHLNPSLSHSLRSLRYSRLRQKCYEMVELRRRSSDSTFQSSTS